MDNTVKTSLNKFIWETERNCSVVGFAWLKSDYFEGKCLAGLIHKNILSFESFREISASLNGDFSIVVESDTEVWATCSTTWKYPLFYTTGIAGAFLSDSPDKLIDSQKGRQIDVFAEKYFYLFGVAPAHFTLIKDLFQITPGEIIKLKKNSVEKFKVAESNIVSDVDSHNVSTEDLQSLIHSVFARYMNIIGNQKVLLPLTRGYDSRLLACLLKSFGHKNVVCATWGRSGNIELDTAQKVAEKLGYRHVFVDYSNEVNHGFLDEEVFKDYIRYSGHFSSMPYFQDYFAVKKLKEEGVIDNETVVLPGHPGDFLRGAHLEAGFAEMSWEKLTSIIISKFGSSLPVTRKTKKELQIFIRENFFQTELLPWKGFEKWDLEERQCKFIGNSVSAFSFFGLKSMMPLFDKEMLQFFDRLPFENKLSETFYNRTLETYFFKPNNVDFDLKPVKKTTSTDSGIKNLIIQIAPSVFKKWYYPLNDAIFYREITMELNRHFNKNELKHPLKPHFYNSYIIQWYLNQIKKG